jgi:tetratricopeptide (TPR) repeat protein
LLIGRLALSQGKLEEARDALEKARNDPLARPAATALLAEVNQRLGAEPLAQHLVAPSVAAGFGRAAAWPDKYVDEVTAMRRGRRAEMAVADGLLARNRPKEALAAAKATIERYPDLGWAWLLSGRAHLQLGDAKQAEQDLRRSIELLPDSVESHFYLGAALVGQGRTADAAGAFRRAADITPDFAQAHYYLAECQSKLGMADEAVASLRRAVAAKPDLVAAHVALARLLRKRGEHDEAREHVQAAIAVEPGNAEARKLLAEIPASEGRK